MRSQVPRRQSPPSWLGYWIGWAALLFWPLLLGPPGPVIEGIWLVIFGFWALLAFTGRRMARRRAAGRMQD